MKNRILIVGGSGFIGTNILKKINKNQNQLFASTFKNKKYYKVTGVKYYSGNLKL